MSLPSGCGTEEPRFTGIDAATSDTPAVDGAPIDAPNADAVDAAVDAAAIDSVTLDATPVDAMGSCDPGLTWCGTSCENLATSTTSCGACGYEVRGGRTCQAGQPFPGWKRMAAVPWAGERARLQSWTGRRFIVLTETGEYSFNPIANTWSGDGSFARPGGFAWSATGEMQWAKLPTVDRVAVWEGTQTNPGDQLYLFTDDGAGGSWEAVADGATLGTRRGATVLADGTNVYVAYGVNQERVARYDASTGGFGISAETPVADFCGSGARFMNPVAIAGGKIFTLGGVGADLGTCPGTTVLQATVPAMPAWTHGAGSLGRRASHVFMEWNGKLVIAGGQGVGPTTSSCTLGDLQLVDPATGAVNATVNPPPTALGSGTFALRAGKGLFFYGGRDVRCDNVTISSFAGGAIGVPHPSSPGNIEWHLLPTSAEDPGARHSIPNDHRGWGSAQPMWTGYEAILFGGYDNTSALLTGSTYQPPVGCVCPSPETAACAGVAPDVPACSTM